jgi:hypothetical protein
MRRTLVQFAVLLLAICRTVYCWYFFLTLAGGIYFFYLVIQKSVRIHSVPGGVISGSAGIAIYSVVSGIAWWMVFRGKPASKQWAIAANLIIAFTWLPLLASESWRYLLKEELARWPVILFGIFGIIIFSIPYQGWRRHDARLN